MLKNEGWRLNENFLLPNLVYLVLDPRVKSILLFITQSAATEIIVISQLQHFRSNPFTCILYVSEYSMKDSPLLGFIFFSEFWPHMLDNALSQNAFRTSGSTSYGRYCVQKNDV